VNWIGNIAVGPKQQEKLRAKSTQAHTPGVSFLRLHLFFSVQYNTFVFQNKIKIETKKLTLDLKNTSCRQF